MIFWNYWWFTLTSNRIIWTFLFSLDFLQFGKEEFTVFEIIIYGLFTPNEWKMFFLHKMDMSSIRSKVKSTWFILKSILFWNSWFIISIFQKIPVRDAEYLSGICFSWLIMSVNEKYLNYWRKWKLNHQSFTSKLKKL
jgi:hypothetical protein